MKSLFLLLLSCKVLLGQDSEPFFPVVDPTTLYVLAPTNLISSNIVAGTNMVVERLTGGSVKLSQANINNQPTSNNLTNWSNVSTGTVFNILPPIGSLMPWLKTLAGVPSLSTNWVQCDGQTISDSNSPLNGQIIPDLNSNNRFLRGNATSGATGGAATHTHTYSGTTDTEDGDIDISDVPGTTSVPAFSHTHTYSGTTASSSSLPPYYNVVWIIRIK